MLATLKSSLEEKGGGIFYATNVVAQRNRRCDSRNRSV